MSDLQSGGCAALLSAPLFPPKPALDARLVEGEPAQQHATTLREAATRCRASERMTARIPLSHAKQQRRWQYATRRILERMTSVRYSEGRDDV